MSGTSSPESSGGLVSHDPYFRAALSGGVGVSFATSKIKALGHMIVMVPSADEGWTLGVDMCEL